MKEEKDRLKSLFQEMKLDSPSADFESRLMQSIHAITEEQAKQEAFSVKGLVAIIGGILCILGIPAAIFWYMGISIKPNIKPISFNLPELNIHPSIISISCVCLSLLIADMLIRKRIWEKKNKD